MTDKRAKLDTVEEVMVELDLATKAGVFDRTSVDVETLLRTADPSSSWSSGRTWARVLSVAAALALVVGTWDLLLPEPSGPLTGPAGVTAESTVGEADLDPCDGSFFGCLSGPTTRLALARNCSMHDYDENGFVDLRDAAVLQRRCTGPVPKER